jgi:NitT/TauT family transport system substrate-binding protein
MNAWNFRAPPLKITAAIAAVMAMALAAGCSTGNRTVTLSAASHSDHAAVTDISVAAIPTTDLAGLYVAQDDGLFAQQGLHVTIVKIASSQAVITDQEAGRVDISAGSYIPYISAQAGGARFRILAEASTLAPGCRLLVTRPGSGINNMADLVGKKIGVNGTNSIGTLLISALFAEHGYPTKNIGFVTDEQGFPVMPEELVQGTWAAAFLAEPYVTLAAEQFGEVQFADLDQGATENFPIDGYVATQGWAKAHPKTVAAFLRAIEAGQALANSDRTLVEAAMAKSDDLSPEVTSLMSLPGFPVGPVDETRIQRVAADMLQFGMLGSKYAAVVDKGTLVNSMLSAGNHGSL